MHVFVCAYVVFAYTVHVHVNIAFVCELWLCACSLHVCQFVICSFSLSLTFSLFLFLFIIRVMVADCLAVIYCVSSVYLSLSFSVCLSVCLSVSLTDILDRERVCVCMFEFILKSTLFSFLSTFVLPLSFLSFLPVSCVLLLSPFSSLPLSENES